METTIAAGRTRRVRRKYERTLRELALVQEQLTCFLESPSDLVFTVDAAGGFVQVNDAFARLLGYTPDELANRAMADLLAPESRRYVRGALTRVMGGASIHGVEATFLARSGISFVLEGSASACVANNHPVLVRGLFKDITLRKEADDAMARHIEELTRSNVELEQAAYVAAHDMQEPLRMISSYLTLLSRRYQGKLDADADEFIGFAVDGAQRLSRMVADLVGSAKVVYTDERHQRVAMDSVLARTLSFLGPALAECSGEVTSDPLPVVDGNPIQLAQLLQNLIANALKYRRPDVAPRVHVSAVEDEMTWSFTVSDNGLGVPRDQAERIFHLFRRLKGREGVPGAGIGLAVARKIVERHGGQIRADSRPGEGSTFSFTLARRGARA